MKKMIFVFAVLLAATAVFSETANEKHELAFKRGTNAIDFGFNLTWSNGIGAVLIYDRGAINNMFSFGADIAYHTRERSFFGIKLGVRDTYLAPNFRFAFHPLGIPAIEAKGAKVLSVMDPYAVLKMGPRFRWTTWDSDIWDYESESSAGFGWGTSLGSRFYVNKTFHFLVELGNYNTILGLGFNF